MDKPSHEFGFLTHPFAAAFSGLQVEPLPDHRQRLDALSKHVHKDGYFYPPQSWQSQVDLRTGKAVKKVPKTKRPAAMFPLLPSHTISVANPIEQTPGVFADDALIVYLLAFAYGTRLQFANWKFDGRVPITPINGFYIEDKTCRHFLERTYAWWGQLAAPLRTRVVNLLYVYTRALALEWEWDAFIHQYMAFDAIFALHLALNPPPNPKVLIPHKERFKVLFDAYGIAKNDPLIDKIYKARNELFHEAMWTGSTIGYGSTDQEAFYLPRHMGRINARLICSIAGYDNQFRKSAWWLLDMFGFDQAP